MITATVWSHGPRREAIRSSPGLPLYKNIELMDIRDAQGSQVIQQIINKKKSEIEKLKDVTQWVKDHRGDVLQGLDIDDKRPQRWQVKPLMVVENELLTPYLLDVGLPVLSLQELRERVESGRLI